MAAQPFVIRISVQEGEEVDWAVESLQLSFRDVLDVIGRILPDVTTTAFEYEDEDGDRITVRSDEEMQAMMSYYVNQISEMQAIGGEVMPLVIYPRACKPAGKRNIHGLTVKTKAFAAGDSGGKRSMSGTGRKQSGDLRQILASGETNSQSSVLINEDDIQYLAILGHGNGGTVYKANHKSSSKLMAVKVIPLDVTPEVQKQIMSELEILYRCDSPHIIGFYGAFFTENRISICTEFMDGGSLELYGAIPEPVLGRIAFSVVTGLNYLWGLKIMHRDVKPSNILVNTKGQVKLCDFGVSVQLVDSIAKTYVGTSAYMAPERILGDEYGIHSDVWSLGLSLLEMALGRFPYPKIQKNKYYGDVVPMEVFQCILTENPLALSAENFSPPFVDFVGRCMQKSPKERPSPMQLLQHPFIQASGDSSDTEVIAMWMGQRRAQIDLLQQNPGLSRPSSTVARSPRPAAPYAQTAPAGSPSLYRRTST
ncbi:dual specificity mitogen-activated protein kinase kinase 5-like isoform X1 [Branchiostoma lanceolatum]|uniref:Dual specificity mitogen-activated protein kinase kinase 5 n=1 Tax=Branchiostoma lanceolatum TaxID=7740 RepID=A0A8K0EJ72_BRALA|nr:MAP2K5 [Branchiostoma lanceolatum]